MYPHAIGREDSAGRRMDIGKVVLDEREPGLDVAWSISPLPNCLHRTTGGEIGR
jgi:hypothetical protein